MKWPGKTQEYCWNMFFRKKGYSFYLIYHLGPFAWRKNRDKAGLLTPLLASNISWCVVQLFNDSKDPLHFSHQTPLGFQGCQIYLKITSLILEIGFKYPIRILLWKHQYLIYRFFGFSYLLALLSKIAVRTTKQLSSKVNTPHCPTFSSYYCCKTKLLNAYRKT